MVDFKFRNFENSDTLLLEELDSDPEVMKYISNGIPSDKSEIERATNVMLSWKSKLDGKYGYWIIEDQKTSEFIGWFHLRPLHAEPNNTTKLELGYRIKRKFWGKGIATKGSKLLIEKAFYELSANEVWAHAMKSNIASTKVMEKCQLIYHHEDVYQDFPGPDKRCVWYVINKEKLLGTAL